MLNSTLDHRECQYQSLKDFTEQVHQEIVDFTSKLNWTVENIETDNDNHLVCLYNSSHRIGKKMLDQHLESCRWKKEGYNEFDVPLPESSLSLSSPSSITLDAQQQNNILKEAKKVNTSMTFESYECCTWLKLCMGERLIPQTSDRIFSDFTRDERKILYEYVVLNTVGANIGCDVAITQGSQCPDEKGNKELSFLELLAQERNLKRRRTKHRGVHTNKKSHTEILREVINQQMELYTDCVSEVHGMSRETKTVDKHVDNAMQNSSSFIDSPKRDTLYLGDPQDNHYGRSKSRHDRTYKQSERTSTSRLKDNEKREKCLQSIGTVETTESWKKSRSHKRKRSRSRERSHDRRNEKHWSTRRSSTKDDKKFRRIEKSFGSSYHSKHSSDRR